MSSLHNHRSLHQSLADLFHQLVLIAWLLLSPAFGESADREHLRAQYSVEKELRVGNFQVLDSLAGRESLPLLYNLLLLAERRQFGENSLSVQSLLVPRISAIPEHAKYLADDIERRSSEAGGLQGRENDFTLLTMVGSREALAELGRFLFDDRNPERERAEKLPPSEVTFALLPNSLMAANGIGRILGPQSPVQERPGFYGPEQVRKIREWWTSLEGEAFRTGFATSRPPDEPPRMEPVQIKEQRHPFPDQSPARSAAKTPAAAVEHKPVWPWFVCGILALVAIVAFALKRRA
jgi:hypothetical protein